MAIWDTLDNYPSGCSPPLTDYIQTDPKMKFSYHPENTTFQNGFLGVAPSIPATISGTLHIRFPEAVEAKSILLNFIGRETVEWVDLKRIRGQKIIVDKSISLWKSTREVGHELITDFDLPFEFQVPEDAVESFKTHFGNVTYTLRAIIKRKPKKKSNICEVRVPILRYTIPDPEEMRPLVIRSHSRPRQVPLSWNAILPSTFFHINNEESIKLQIIAHNPTLRIKKISACLKTLMTYTVDDSNVISLYREKRHSKHEVFLKDITIEPFGPDISFKADVKIRIPDDVPPTCKTKHITIKNEIQIKVTFEKSRHHVLIMREIFVGRNFNNERAGSLVRRSVRRSLDFSEIPAKPFATPSFELSHC
ncbi:hypothetical protein G9A89_014286 [Geosiphon pyriformis]|nr:hypothetical protein G9A89_014286 [Geosiphon pyriformis]